MDTSILINKLIKAITYKYRDDRIVPGLIISYLATDNYYCSIVRYSGLMASNKEIVCKSTRDNLFDALKDIANDFSHIAFEEQNPIQELCSFMRDINDS